ncbi:hypothetical protein KBC04_05190 [Candidatus Babeliales bacterium]|nr:hypothetical protein [Candidatus Babeliales bacterium]MBP9844140.1 hypothetical protein [Candidatus Babeliales bacterium]
MTAFQKGIVSLSLLMACIYFFQWHTPDMTIVYPDNCVFVIDKLFSKPMQLQIKAFIDDAYKKSKSPSHLLPHIESTFPAIKSVVIDMQNPEFLNFTIQTYQPIFLLNHEHVVCQYGKLFDKQIFSQAILATLENISFEGAISQKNVDRIMQFFELLTDPILKDFSIRWIDKHAIWLDQKVGQDLSLLVGYEHIPTLQDIAQCRNLRGQISDTPCKDKKGKPCKNSLKWVCDLRFDQQIVLFSTK